MTMRLIGTPKILSPYGEASTIWFYEPSTNTKKDVFSDANLSTPINQSSGIAADSAGFWPTIYCSPALYRIIVKDANGITRQDEDNFDPGLAAGFGVTSVVGVAQGGTESTTAAGARQKLDVPSNATMQTAQDNITALQIAVATGVDGDGEFGALAALNKVSRDELASGYGNIVIQSVNATPYTASTAISTPSIPLDDTTPLISEGTEILTANITPRSSSNKIRITIDGFGYTTGTGAVGIWAIFRGSTCIYAKVQGINPIYVDISTTYVDSPASTSEKTYSVRISSNNLGSIYMNGSNAGRYFGGVAACTMRLEEIEVH